jgi:siroheme synthase-like protein
MGYYAAFLDLGHRHCLVVGGGPETEAKVRGLLRAGARVTLVSATITSALEELAATASLELERRRFQASDLDGCILVIDASGDDATGIEVARRAREQAVLVNVVDRPARCDFIAPALVQRGALQLAISTGGRSPFMASHVRRVLEETIGPEWGELVEMVGEVRDRLRLEGVPLPRQDEIYARIAAGGALELLRRGLRDEARQALETCVSTPTSA